MLTVLTKYKLCYVKLNQSLQRKNINIYIQQVHPLANLMGQQKIHKLSEGDQVDKLPVRPIISNIGTATYRLAKHLAKLLLPLSTSEYTVKSAKDFIDKIRTIKVPKEYHMVSFEVKSLFTNVPLEYTIDLMLKRIYDDHEISTTIIKK